jgi:hypothetical protein
MNFNLTGDIKSWESVLNLWLRLQLEETSIGGGEEKTSGVGGVLEDCTKGAVGGKAVAVAEGEI